MKEPCNASLDRAYAKHFDRLATWLRSINTTLISQLTFMPGKHSTVNPNNVVHILTGNRQELKSPYGIKPVPIIFASELSEIF